MIYSRQDKEILISTKYDLYRSDIRIFDVYTGKQSRILADVTDLSTEVCQMTLSHLSMRVVVGNQKGEAREIQHSNGVTMNTMQMHKEEIICLSFSLRHDLLLSAGWDNTIKIWSDNAYYEPLKILTDVHTDNMSGCTCSWEQGVFATYSDSGAIIIWDIINLACRGSTKTEDDIDSLHLSDKFPILAVAESSGRISVYNISTPENIHKAIYYIKGESIAELPVKIVFDTSEKEFLDENKFFKTNEFQDCKEIKYGMYIAYDSGFVGVWNVGKFVKHVKPGPKQIDTNLTKKAIINANTFSSIINLGIGKAISPVLSPELIVYQCRTARWKSHKDGVSDMLAVQISEKLIITVGKDTVLKIWNTKGDLKGSVGISRLEPDIWALKINTFAYRERLYSQAEAILRELANNHDTEYIVSNKQNSLSGTVRATELIDAQNRSTSRTFNKLVQEKPRSNSTLRQMDIKKKSTDKYKKLFNPNVYGLKEFEEILPPKSFEKLEPLDEKPVIRKRNYESVAELAKKLESIDRSFEKNSIRQTYNRKPNVSSQDEEEAKKRKEREVIERAIKRKKIQIKTSTRSSSVPLLPRRPFKPSKGHSKAYQLVQDLNTQVIKSMNRNSLPVHIKYATPNKLLKISNRDSSQSKSDLHGPHYGLPITPSESAANIMKGFVENNDMFNTAADSVVKFYQEIGSYQKLNKNF